MRDYFEIGPTPADEPCAQLGAPGYSVQRARAECRAFINQIRRTFGPEPEGARLFVKSNAHEFGTYYEVAVEFETPNFARAACVSDPEYFPEPEGKKALEYAVNVENNAPTSWDEAALSELNIKEKGGVK